MKTLLKDQFFVNENLDISLKPYQIMFYCFHSQHPEQTLETMNFELDKPSDLMSNNTSDANPDPMSGSVYVFGPSGSGSFYHQAKIVRKTLIPTVLSLL
jgi:hypothetical protein